MISGSLAGPNTIRARTTISRAATTNVYVRLSASRDPDGELPAFLPATLVPLYLRDPRKEVSIHRRQLALLGASLRGRI